MKDQSKTKQLQASIRQLMMQHKISIKELHLGSGVATATIQRIRSGTTNPTMEVLEALAKFFKISIAELLEEKQLKKEPLIEHVVQIPLVPWETLTCLKDQMKTSARYIVSELQLGKNSFALRLEENFSPLFTKGSFIILDPDEPVENKSYILVIKNGSFSPSIKQFIIYDDKQMLVPLTPMFEAVELTKEFQVLGTIVQIKFNMKGENTHA